MNREPGLRTVLALHEPDGKTPRRIRYFRRTVDQIQVAGAAGLASELGFVLDHAWGTETEEGSLSTQGGVSRLSPPLREAAREVGSRMLGRSGIVEARPLKGGLTDNRAVLAL